MTRPLRARLMYVELPVVAQPLIQWLQSQVVDARLSSDDAGGLHPSLTFVHGTWLTVPETQTAQAQQLVAQFERSLTLIDETFPSETEEES